jgi:uncharacterized protein (DUF433 family)
VSDPLVLDRELYSEPEAARLLGRSPSTLHYWLQGGERRGTVYPPVIRSEPKDTRWVTWAEFIEAGWLSTYRRDKGVPMKELRVFIEDLRQRVGVPYPLAHSQPLVSGRKLVMAAQEASKLAPEFYLVVPVENQFMLSYAGGMFLERVVWDGDVAAGWKVHSAESPVTIRPDVRFGRPAITGVSTESIFEASEDGAAASEIAEDFGLTVPEVRWALAYEEQRHTA